MPAPLHPFGGYGTVCIYSTPSAMAAKVEEYFEQCFTTKIDRNGVKRQVELHTPTFAGLARYLGFSSRAELLNYKNARDEEYEYIIKDARLRIEDYLEGKLVYAKNPSGIMFSLKNNADWEDKTKQQISGEDDKPLVFGWAADAKDVIDVNAVKPEESLPKPTPLLPGDGQSDGSMTDGDC